MENVGGKSVAKYKSRMSNVGVQIRHQSRKQIQCSWNTKFLRHHMSPIRVDFIFMWLESLIFQKYRRFPLTQ